MDGAVIGTKATLGAERRHEAGAGISSCRPFTPCGSSWTRRHGQY